MSLLGTEIHVVAQRAKSNAHRVICTCLHLLRSPVRRYAPTFSRQSLTYVKKNGLEKEVVILVLELAVGGELFDFMMYTGAFPEVIARTYFCQVRHAGVITRGCLHGLCRTDPAAIDWSFRPVLSDAPP